MNSNTQGHCRKERDRWRNGEAAYDLRALSPESALADLVKAKIERLLAEQTDIGADDK